MTQYVKFKIQKWKKCLSSFHWHYILTSSEINFKKNYMFSQGCFFFLMQYQVVTLASYSRLHICSVNVCLLLLLFSLWLLPTVGNFWYRVKGPLFSKMFQDSFVHWGNQRNACDMITPLYMDCIYGLCMDQVCGQMGFNCTIRCLVYGSRMFV